MEKDTQVNMNCDQGSGTPNANRVEDDQGVIIGGAAARAASQSPESCTTAGGDGVAGGQGRKGNVNDVDALREDAYWRDNFAGQTYVEQGASFVDYGPAYGFGVTSYGRYPGRSFEEAEPEMAGSWSGDRRGSSLSWEGAKQAVRDAWNRISGSS